MDKESKTRALEQWLRMVDKPLSDKKEDEQEAKKQREDKTQKKE